MVNAARCRKCETKECSTCDHKPPKLFKINREAFILWMAVKTQWRSAGLGLIGLDYDAVEREAARQGVLLREKSGAFNRCLWKKIKVLEAYELERQGKPNERNRSVERDKEVRKKLGKLSVRRR